jgi:predicted metal-dependent hydrolase
LTFSSRSGRIRAPSRRTCNESRPIESHWIAALIESLERDAARIARVFGLRYRTIEPEKPHVKRRLGVCYRDGTIRIRLCHASTGRPLKYSSLVDTLCHELAHLRHFNHGRRFQAFYRRILEHARREGIYRPGHLEAPRPRPAPGAPRATRAGAPLRPIAPARPQPQQLALF